MSVFPFFLFQYPKGLQAREESVQILKAQAKQQENEKNSKKLRRVQ